MNRTPAKALAPLLAALVSGCAALRPLPAAEITLRPLAPGVLLHTSWKTLPGVGPFPSNGLVLLGRTEAALVDTAWGDAPTAALLDTVERVHGRKVTRLLVTHSHDDRMGGIREALRRGVAVHALEQTAALAARLGEPVPPNTFSRQAAWDWDGVRVEAFFPGPAHAPDNVVAWLPGARVLFGSCLVREARAGSLGNLADASVTTWASAVEALEARYPEAVVVVPGHGEPGDAGLLTHTAQLARAAATPP